jgi:hypothetical protein
MKNIASLLFFLLSLPSLAGVPSPDSVVSSSSQADVKQGALMEAVVNAVETATLSGGFFYPTNTATGAIVRTVDTTTGATNLFPVSCVEGTNTFSVSVSYGAYTNGDNFRVQAQATNSTQTSGWCPAYYLYFVTTNVIFNLGVAGNSTPIYSANVSTLPPVEFFDFNTSTLSVAMKPALKAAWQPMTPAVKVPSASAMLAEWLTIQGIP